MSAETRKCGWCLNPYEHQPRRPAEIEDFRRALFIAEPAFEPSICDGCFRTVMETAPQSHRIADVPNFLLRVA